MNRTTIGMYGIATYLYQKQRITNISSQHLINLSTGGEVHSKDTININLFWLDWLVVLVTASSLLVYALDWFKSIQEHHEES